MIWSLEDGSRRHCEVEEGYGGLMEGPDYVNILIAGFACVDFSCLKKNAKSLSEVGEPANTLRGIMEYSKKNSNAPQS